MTQRRGRQERTLTRAIQHLVPVERNLAREDVALQEQVKTVPFTSSTDGTASARAM